MYNIIFEMNHQSRFDVGYRMLGAGAREWSRDDYGVGGGKGVQDWELMYTRGWFMSMHGKTNTVL